jgi:hypothetical protein
MAGSKIQVYRGSAEKTVGGVTREGLIKRGGRIVSAAKHEAAKHNPALRAWLSAIKMYKKSVGIPEGEFFLTPKKGTAAHKEITKIYRSLL